MIIEVIAGVFEAITNFFVTLLPVAGDLGLATATGWLYGYTWLDSMIPLHESIALAGVALGVFAAVFGFGLLRTLIQIVKP